MHQEMYQVRIHAPKHRKEIESDIFLSIQEHDPRCYINITFQDLDGFSTRPHPSLSHLDIWHSGCTVQAAVILAHIQCHNIQYWVPRVMQIPFGESENVE